MELLLTIEGINQPERYFYILKTEAKERFQVFED